MGKSYLPAAHLEKLPFPNPETFGVGGGRVNRKEEEDEIFKKLVVAVSLVGGVVATMGGFISSHGRHLSVFTWACGDDAAVFGARDFVWALENFKKTGGEVSSKCKVAVTFYFSCFLAGLLFAPSYSALLLAVGQLLAGIFLVLRTVELSWVLADVFEEVFD